MIAHLDLDCFFVSASIIGHQELSCKNLVVVGGGDNAIFGQESIDEDSRIILSANYSARKFGIKAAMPLFLAKELCKELVVLKSDFALYKRLSKDVYLLLYSYTPDIEQASIDEFYIDLSGSPYKNDPLKFAKELQQRILNELELCCSIGISQNKDIAKFCTTKAKPFGIMLCNGDEFLAKFGLEPIKSFPMVGSKLSEKLYKKGVVTIKDAVNSKFIFEQLGQNGVKIYNSLIATPTTQIQTDHKRKSMGFSRTFLPIKNRDEIKRRLAIICRHLSFDIYLLDLHPQTFELKIRYINGAVKSRRKTQNGLFYEELLWQISNELLDLVDESKNRAINKLSLTVSNLKEEGKVQRDLFFDEEKKELVAQKAVQELREKYGVDIVFQAKEAESFES